MNAVIDHLLNISKVITGVAIPIITVWILVLQHRLRKQQHELSVKQTELDEKHYRLKINAGGWLYSIKDIKFL